LDPTSPLASTQRAGAKVSSHFCNNPIRISHKTVILVSQK
jgi:hypothetical protein